MLCVHDSISRPKGPRRLDFNRLGSRGLLLALIITFCPGSLVSQDRSDEENRAKPLRIDVNPFVGYRTSIDFPTVQNAQGLGSNVTFDAKPSYGLAVGRRLDEEDLIEIRWSRQKSNVHLQGGFTSPESVVLDQIHGDFTHEYILYDWPVWARPFVTGSVGATHVGGENSSFTRFSFGLGGGIKIFFNRHIGLKMQAEWLPIVVNPEVATVFCGGGCVVHLSATAVSQAEAMIGPVFRF
jgi:hypothetical protein